MVTINNTVYAQMGFIFIFTVGDLKRPVYLFEKKKLVLLFPLKVRRITQSNSQELDC